MPRRMRTSVPFISSACSAIGRSFRQSSSLQYLRIEHAKSLLKCPQTTSMIPGMLPMAASKSAGAEVKNGMVWTIIGGPTSSLILTLRLAPCIYYIIDRLLARTKKAEVVRTGDGQPAVVPDSPDPSHRVYSKAKSAPAERPGHSLLPSGSVIYRFTSQSSAARWS